MFLRPSFDLAKVGENLLDNFSFCILIVPEWEETAAPDPPALVWSFRENGVLKKLPTKENQGKYRLTPEKQNLKENALAGNFTQWYSSTI